jgi:hypothetical protein
MLLRDPHEQRGFETQGGGGYPAIPDLAHARRTRHQTLFAKEIHSVAAAPTFG